MIKQITKLVQKSNLLKVILFFLLFLIVDFFINGDIIGVGKLLQITKGINILDLEWHYSSSQAYDILAGLGEMGRSFYLTRIIPLDFIYPLSYMLFHMFTLLFLLRISNFKNPIIHFIVFAPIAAALFDFLENVMIIIMLNAYPRKIGISFVVGYLTSLKNVFVGIDIIGIFILILINAGMIINVLILNIWKTKSIKGALSNVMCKKVIALFVIFLCLGWAPIKSFIFEDVQKEMKSNIETSNQSGEQEVLITVKSGEHYYYDEGNGLFSRLTNPQMAIWAEDKEGNFIKTLFITKKAGTSGWGKDKNRAAVLPCWSHSQGKVYETGSYMPTTEEPVTDGISSATPTGDFELKTAFQDIGEAVLYLEINQSYDYNDYYSEDALGDATLERTEKSFSGQPAVVYSVTIDTSKPNQNYEMQLLGHSDPKGESGEVFSDVSKLGKALEMIDSVYVTIK